VDLGEPVFRSEGSVTGELEATEIKTLLEANNLKAIVLRDSAGASMPFIVCVARKDVDRARVLVSDSSTAELEAAEQAESELAGGSG
jgi:hypothetical protein